VNELDKQLGESQVMKKWDLPNQPDQDDGLDDLLGGLGSNQVPNVPHLDSDHGPKEESKFDPDLDVDKAGFDSIDDYNRYDKQGNQLRDPAGGLGADMDLDAVNLIAE